MDYFCADRAGIRKAEQYIDSGKIGQKEKRMQIADAFAEEWQEWKKEAGIILGRTKQSFLEGAF